MKIAIIGAISFDSLEFHLHDEIVSQGHQCKIFDFFKFLPSRFDWGLTLFSMNYMSFINKILLNNVLEYNPDLVIVTYRHVHPFVIKEIKLNKIKIISINPDALSQFQRQQLFVEPFDVYFSKDPYTVRFMKDKLLLNVYLYQEAFNLRIHFIPNLNHFDLENDIGIDVLAFGSLYPYRNRILHVLKERGINFTLYGSKSKFFDPFLLKNFQNKIILGEEKVKLMNGSKIVFNNFHYAEIESVNNKFFEIFGSGSFQICDYKPILKDLLPIDPGLISYKSIDEAERLIKFYLTNPEKRYEIRDIVTRYFHKNYTYKNLIDFIFNKTLN